MAVIVVGGNKIEFDMQGNGDSTMVFLHGIGSDMSVWNELVDYFSPKYKIVRFDWKGFGESKINAPDPSFAIETMARELQAILDNLNVGSNFYVIADFPSSIIALKADIDELVKSDGIIAINAADKGKVKVKFNKFSKNLTKEASIKMQDRVRIEGAIQVREEIITQWLKECKQFDISRESPYINTPVDFVIGQKNTSVSEKDAIQTVGRIPVSRVTMLEGGDLLMLENPKRLISEIEDFIENYIPEMA